MSQIRAQRRFVPRSQRVLMTDNFESLQLPVKPHFSHSRDELGLAAEVQCRLVPISFTLRHNQRDIVLLFSVTEFLYFIDNRRYQGLWR